MRERQFMRERRRPLASIFKGALMTERMSLPAVFTRTRPSNGVEDYDEWTSGDDVSEAEEFIPPKRKRNAAASESSDSFSDSDSSDGVRGRRPKRAPKQAQKKARAKRAPPPKLQEQEQPRSYADFFGPASARAQARRHAIQQAPHQAFHQAIQQTQQPERRWGFNTAPVRLPDELQDLHAHHGVHPDILEHLRRHVPNYRPPQ